jgi:hypothetical protein
MPATERDLWDWLKDFGPGPLKTVAEGFGLRSPAGSPDSFAVLEKVGGYVGEAQPGSAAFKFGMSYGALRMALTAAGIPFDEVTPQRWQKTLGVTPREKGEPKSSFKARLKTKAQSLFPRTSITLKTADALLLAEYCRRLRAGRL